jgi:4,5-dihydroxyphthalate decarboxylase
LRQDAADPHASSDRVGTHAHAPARELARRERTALGIVHQERVLLAGEIDAAVVGDGKPADPRIQPVIADADAAARAWQRRTGAIQINHMVVVKESVPRAAADEVSRLLRESIRAAGNPEMNPCGVEANRRNLEVAIDYVHRQRLIPRRFTVEELFA